MFDPRRAPPDAYAYALWAASQQQHRPDAEVFPNDIPARVLTAVIFLRDLTGKTAPVIVGRPDAHGGGDDRVDGQELTEGEAEAQGAACGLLRRYFDGDLVLDPYEGVRLAAGHINLGPAAGQLPPGGTRVECAVCEHRRATKQPPLGEGCVWCRGTGWVVVYSLAPDQGGHPQG